MSEIRIKKERKERRILRLKGRITGTAERPRICFTQTNKNIYAQAVDDTLGKTMAAVSSLEKELSLKEGSRKNRKTALLLAEKFCERLKGKNIGKVVFDRRDKKYHGVVKAFADKLREKGIQV